MLRRLVAQPSWHDWAFPLLLGALAIAVLAVAAMVTQGNRPYWAVFALLTVLGPNRQQTVKDGWGTTAAALLGVAGALLIMRLPIPSIATILIAVSFGTVGALILLLSKMLSKTALTVLVMVMVSVLAGNDLRLVGGEGFIETAIGATGAVLAAGLAEFLAVRMEGRQMESATAH